MRIRYLAVIVTVIAASALTLMPGAVSATVKAGPHINHLGDTYGAIAYSPSHQSVVAAAGGKTATDADVAAIKKCGRSDCIPVGWAEHAYLAFYLGSGGWGWGTDSTSQAAEQDALGFCENSGATGCHLVLEAVTSSPSAASFAWSDLMGRACVFNAPKGGVPISVDGKTISGHVGWAYLVDRYTGEWEFGANEGPEAKVGSTSKTWLAEATWPELLKLFRKALPGTGKHPNYYHPAGYYKTFRCASTAANNSTDALTEAQNEYGEPYFIPLTDCLSQVALVLGTYGAPVSEHAYLLDPRYWVPNKYYKSKYMSQFEPEKSL